MRLRKRPVMEMIPKGGSEEEGLTHAFAQIGPSPVVLRQTGGNGQECISVVIIDEAVELEEHVVLALEPAVTTDCVQDGRINVADDRFGSETNGADRFRR